MLPPQNPLGQTTSHLQQHKTYLDILRVLAIFLVVYNHTPGYYFPTSAEWSIPAQWGILLLNQLVKMAVPLFLMVTGALMFHRDEGIYSLFKKRILRFTLVLFIIYTVQYSLICYKEGMFPNGRNLCRIIFNREIINQFFASWFLYAYLGILLMLPILRSIAKSLSNNIFLYLLGIQITFCCIIPLLYMIACGRYVSFCYINGWLPFHPEDIHKPYSAGYLIFYGMMGYYLEHRVSLTQWRKHKNKLISLATLFLLAGVGCMEMAKLAQQTEQLHESVIYLTAFLPIPCAVIYMELKRLCIDTTFSPVISKTISLIGAAVFTVMLTENIFRVQWADWYHSMEPMIGRIPAALIYTSGICFAALVLGLILKRIPYLKHIF